MTAESTSGAPDASSPARILLVDDNPTNLQVLYHTLNGLGFKLFVAKSGESALKLARKHDPQLVLLDIMMPGIDGYETCRRLKDDPQIRDAAVIFLSALTDTEAKVRGFELGAVDFITKPFQNEEVIARVNAHLTIDRLQREVKAQNQALEHELAVAREYMHDARSRVDGPLLGDSIAVRALREAIANHAASSDTLLLGGPVNAGQEAVARAIHHASDRGAQAFIYVNCALSQDNSSELLLGSGDNSKLHLATGGTLYLDGIHLIAGDVQERLLAVLADRNDDGAGPDVRIIAYTPQDLTQAVQAGKFDSQLLKQLARNALTVPSLAERRDDVLPLAMHYAGEHANRLGTVFERISDESRQRLSAYRWPGNIKELQSVIERAVANAPGAVIEIDQGLLEEGVPLGHYRLLGKLGEGGMGEVWRAKHQLLARPAAVKLIRDDASFGDDRQAAVDRFRREAAAIANLNSPNTIKLFDFGVSEAGAFYYVMELLEGLDVKALVKRFGALPPARAVVLLRQACRSLAEAHDAGLMHRDIKPANLFVCKLGPEHDFVKVLDFGIVKPLGEAAERQADLTQDKGILGTPAYIAPELLLRSKALDGRADIYSLGCVAYYMLTGRPLFTGDAVSVAMQQVNNAPELPSKKAPGPIPERLEQVIMACLEKEPDRRPASALELWQRLGEVRFEQPWTEAQAEDWWMKHLSTDDATPAPDLPPLDLDR